MPKLDSPKIDYIPSYIAALREGYRFGIQKAKTEEEIQEIENHPQAFLDDFFAVKTGPITYSDGTILPRIPHTKFWFVQDDLFLGEIVVRHVLNEKLMQVGGHIGYGIRPSISGRGHATEMLRHILGFCKNTLNLEKVLITVNEDNIPSIKVIEKNGGILENTVISHFDNLPARRYWIPL